MGCDIHIITEIKRTAGADWEEVKLPFYATHRDYDLFARLRGVRNSHDLPVIKSKHHLPADSPHLVLTEDSTIYRRNEYDDDWFGDHSFTHYTLAEMKEVCKSKWEPLAVDYDTYNDTIDFDPAVTYFLQFIGFAALHNYHDLRILIGFDS